MNEIELLQERIKELENAANKLMLVINNGDSPFHDDAFLKLNLTKVLKERAAVAKKIQQLRRQNDC